MDNWIHICTEFIVKHELIEAGALLSAVVVAFAIGSIFVFWFVNCRRK